MINNNRKLSPKLIMLWNKFLFTKATYSTTVVLLPMYRVLCCAFRLVSYKKYIYYDVSLD